MQTLNKTWRVMLVLALFATLALTGASRVAENSVAPSTATKTIPALQLVCSSGGSGNGCGGGPG